MAENINYEYEKNFLDDYMESLKFFEPFVYKKIYRTGILCKMIGKEFNIKDVEYYLAGFYANISLQPFNNILEKYQLSEFEKEQIKRHPVLASEYLKYKGLLRAAEYVYYHHELPDGSGYYKTDAYPIESLYINISDVFEGLITPKNYRPPMTLREALDITLKPYKNGLKIPIENLEKIKNILINFYNQMLSIL